MEIMSKLSLIIPVYNEEENIDLLLEGIIASRNQIVERSGISDLEVIAVDDGSRDKTAEILKRYSGEVKVLTHASNRGYGAALKSGFEYASGDLLSFMDADGTCNPESFIMLCRNLESGNADIAVGSRMDKNRSEMPVVRWVGNKFFASLLTFFSGQKVSDSASGIRVFKKDVIRKLYPLPDGLHFTPAMTAKALHEGFKIVEVAVPYAERGGESKLRVIKDGFRFLKIIVDTILMYNPFKVFLLLGLLAILIAAILLAVPIYSLISHEDFIFSDYIYRSIGALYFVVAGFQIILFGVLARFIVSTFFKRYESGRLVHKINDLFKVYDRMALYGLVPIFISLVVNSVYAYKYFFGKGIKLHWAYLLIAAGFMLIGMQMVITGIVIKILKNIAMHKTHQEKE
jgi:glycosyltransferase involved in cell wall biosynthesis